MRGMRSDKLKAIFLLLWLWLPSLVVLTTDQVQGAAAVFALLAFSFLLLAAPIVPIARPRHYFLFLSPFALLVAPYCFLTLAYHSVPGDALIAAALNTNLSLTLDVLRSFGWIVWLVPLSLLIYLLLARSISPTWRLAWAWRQCLLAGLLLYAMVGMLSRVLIGQRVNLPPMFEYSTASLSFPSGLALSLQRIYSKHRGDEQFSSLHAYSAIGDQPLLVVLVLGESLRADHLGLYGYARATTPRLSAMADELLSFPDVVSSANWTSHAVQVLSAWRTGAQQASLVGAFREAGFRTAWLSNQNRFPQGRMADVVEYGVDAQDFHNRTDANLMPMFTSFVRQAGPRQFVVLHMHGSHIPYDDRYEAAARKFTPTLRDLGISSPQPADKAATVNSYDNTVVATDDFLARVIAVLRQESRPAIMLFTSDHGENLFDDERALWMHAQRGPTRADLQVPLLVWANSAYRLQFSGVMGALRQNRGRKISHRQVFPTLMDIGGLAWDGRDPRLSFASAQFEESRRMVQYDLDTQIDFEQLR